jgi:hypothetical protein
METLEFSNNSFVLYQILPDHKKILFLSETFDSEDTTDDITMRYYQNHFESILNKDGSTELGILSYTTVDGDRVNVIFQDNYVHVNSDRLIPIKELVSILFDDGNILVRDIRLKKNKSNRERYHMRFYRAYKKINPEHWLLPIVLN